MKNNCLFNAALIVVFSLLITNTSFSKEDSEKKRIKKDAAKAFEPALERLAPISPITGKKLETLVKLIEFKKDLASNTSELLTLTIAICKEKQITPYELQKLLDCHKESTKILFNALSDQFIIPVSFYQVCFALNNLIHQHENETGFLRSLQDKKTSSLPDHALLKTFSKLTKLQIANLLKKTANLEKAISHFVYNEKRSLSGPVFKQASRTTRVLLKENKRLTQLLRKVDIQIDTALIQLEQINYLLSSPTNRLMLAEAGKFYAKSRIELGISLRQINTHLKGLDHLIAKLNKIDKSYYEDLIKKSNSTELNRFHIHNSTKEKQKLNIELETKEESIQIRNSIIEALNLINSPEILNSLKVNENKYTTFKTFISELFSSPGKLDKASEIAKKLELKKKKTEENPNNEESKELEKL